MKILVVEDNKRLAERIHYKLAKDFAVDIVDNGEDALERCLTIAYSLVILDLNLPRMSGIDVCYELRRRHNTVPILVLSGLSAVSTKVELLDYGADDYLTKPFDAGELKARILALIRRKANHTFRSVLTYHDLKVNLEKRLVTRQDQPITLRRKEFDILVYLLENRGRVLTRQMIMDHVWATTSSSWLSTIDVHIKHLRDKIDKPFHTSTIKTAYGVGYRIDDPSH